MKAEFVPVKKATVYKTVYIRMSDETQTKLGAIAKRHKVKRSELILQMIEFAIENMK